MRLSVTTIALTITALFVVSSARADRIMTSPATQGGVAPVFEFFNFDLSPDDSTIVVNAQLNSTPAGELYSLPVPANPAADTVAVTQISTQSFLLPAYDVDGAPVISPNGATVLFTHDRGSDPAINTIHSTPIGGETANDFFTGLFSGSSTGGPADNQVAPGAGNIAPLYTPNGSTVVFLNLDAGTGATDRLYTIPVGGGAPTALTPDGVDIDGDLYDVNNTSVVFAPDDDNTLFIQPVGGGAATQINFTPSAVPGFDIDNRVALTPDGTGVLFIGDYFTAGQNELLSAPIAGGAVTRISDTLPADGDVTNFEISPDGSQVVYAAGQNSAESNELFLTPISGGTGNSVRVSDAPGVGDGSQDVSTVGGAGVIHWSSDGSQIFYFGDMTTNGVNDLYVVDTSAKGGLVPAAVTYTYVGAAGGSLFEPTNWEDVGANNPAAASLPRSGDIPADDIELNLVINGSTVTSDGDLDFGDNGSGSLTLTGGAVLNVSGDVGFDFDIDSDGTLTVTDSTISVPDNVFFGGTTTFTNATINSGDDIDIQSTATVVISGGTFTAQDDVEIFGGSSLTIDGATFVSTSPGGTFEFQGTPDESSTITGVSITTSRFVIESQEDDDIGEPGVVSMTDSTITVNGPANDADGVDAGSLTLLGQSSFTATVLQEGFDLLLDGESDGVLNGDATLDYLGGAGLDGLGASVTLLSADATISLPAFANSVDSRDFIFDGLTGLTYNQDPTAFNVDDWDGISAVTLSLADSLLLGDADGDGDVDGDDLIAVQTEFGATGATPLLGDADGDGDVDGDDLIAVQTEFGNVASVAVPEPMAVTLLLAAAAGCALLRNRF